MKRIFTLVALPLVSLVPSLVSAQTCVGVEARVNARTSQLTSAVTTEVSTKTAEMVAQELLERQQLLSAIRVLTQQTSVSGQQEVVADRASNLAFSHTIVTQSVNTQIHEAVRDYGNTGYNACGIVEQGRTVAQMVGAYGKTRGRMAERVREGRTATTTAEFREQMGEWSALAGRANGATIQAVLDGDEEQAQAFMAVVAGPPRPPIQQGTSSVLSRQDRVIALQEEARSSAAVLVLADIAASQRLQGELDKMTNSWIGEDGGARWAASMAASPTRAVLLDTARIEAQTVAAAALELKGTVMEEFALASFALTYADRMRERLAQETREE